MSTVETAVERLVVEVEQLQGYAFRVGFPGTGADDLRTDEPPPLGEGEGPNPTRLLAAAVGNCLAASLLFCLQKARVEGARVRATVTLELVRNERKRLRVGGIDVELTLDGVEAVERDRLDRCLELFEDYCVVTQSVRQGVAVTSRVEVGEGVPG